MFHVFAKIGRDKIWRKKKGKNLAINIDNELKLDKHALKTFKKN